MKKWFFFCAALFPAVLFAARPAGAGPYTVTRIDRKVYRIEDSNAQNPAGHHYAPDGHLAGVNNCSDMYLIVGRDRALLIDLSNRITWYEDPGAWLRGLIAQRIGRRPLVVALTHAHGDHMGMIDAFRDDPAVNFWVPAADFAGSEVFPADRTVFFEEGASLDLGGGCRVHSLMLPGHTDGSTVYFLEGSNRVFTGDAVGSGSGVWLFTPESFFRYAESIDRLIAYVEDPACGLDPEHLTLYGGHYWQRGRQEHLGMQYLRDMRTLIERIREGRAETSPMTGSRPFLDTDFRFGTATIAWNRQAAAALAAQQAEP